MPWVHSTYRAAEEIENELEDEVDMDDGQVPNQLHIFLS